MKLNPDFHPESSRGGGLLLPVNDQQHTESLLTEVTEHCGQFSPTLRILLEEFNLLMFNLPFEMGSAQQLFYRGLESQ